jgi:hypothetical protein
MAVKDLLDCTWLTGHAGGRGRRRCVRGYLRTCRATFRMPACSRRPTLARAPRRNRQVTRVDRRGGGGTRGCRHQSCTGFLKIRRVQRGHLRRGGQTRGDDTPMLKCSGCRVARLCNAVHQKMASKKATSGGNLRTGQLKDICRVLSKWREVVKDGVAPDSRTTDLLAFLQR